MPGMTGNEPIGASDFLQGAGLWVTVLFAFIACTVAVSAIWKLPAKKAARYTLYFMGSGVFVAWIGTNFYFAGISVQDLAFAALVVAAVLMGLAGGAWYGSLYLLARAGEDHVKAEAEDGLQSYRELQKEVPYKVDPLEGVDIGAAMATADDLAIRARAEF